MASKIPEIVVTLTNLTRDDAPFEITADQSIRIPVPRGCDFQKMKKDCDLLLQMFGDHEKDVANLVRQVSDGKMMAARRTATKLGLSEQAFCENGGGLAWVLVPIAIGILLWPSEAH